MAPAKKGPAKETGENGAGEKGPAKKTPANWGRQMADKTPAKRGSAKVPFFAGKERLGEEGLGENGRRRCRRRKGAGVGAAGEKGDPGFTFH